jgi:hypothetical protein
VDPVQFVGTRRSRGTSVARSVKRIRLQPDNESNACLQACLDQDMFVV